jgi:hypothetical protein
MKRAILFVAALIIALLPFSGVHAQSQTAVPWQGHGSDSIRVCDLDETPYLHWVLTPGGNFTITGARLETEGGPYPPGPPFQAQVVHFYTPYLDGALEGTLEATAYATFTGRGTARPLLVISDGCLPGITAEKDAEATWTRAWEWDIEKNGDIDEATFQPGDTTPRTVTYTAKVSATPENTYNVSGSVVVTNHPQGQPTDITSIEDDTFDLECDPEPPTTLDPGESVTCTFDEDLEAKTDGTNTVTVTLDDGSTVEASADWAFGTTPDEETDECITVVDDAGTPGDTTDDVNLGEVCADQLVNGEYTFPTYQATIDPTDERFLPCCNEVDFENIAAFTTNDTEATGSDNHIVVVHVLCEFEGCTPGFWNLNGPLPGGYTPANVDAWAATGYDPDDLMPVGGVTFRTALGSPGGGSTMTQQLNFQTAAALLNAENPYVSYPLTTQQIIDGYNAAVAAGTGAMEEFKDLLDGYNNLGCPDRGGVPTAS